MMGIIMDEFMKVGLGGLGMSALRAQKCSVRLEAT